MAGKVTRGVLRLDVFRDEEFDHLLLRALGVMRAGGAALAECLFTARRIEDGDPGSWVRAWTETADRTRTDAERLLARGHEVSARGTFLRASTYYRLAHACTVPGDASHGALWLRSRECFQRAGALFDPFVEPVEIPFEGTPLPGYFIPGGREAAERPTLLVLPDHDGTAEEAWLWVGPAAVRRGYNTLVFEGPGQGGALQATGLTFRPDAESFLKAVVDYARSRIEVDVDHLALAGFGWGGHFAMRGAALEQRIHAVVADPPVVDLAEYVMGGLPESVQAAVRGEGAPARAAPARRDGGRRLWEVAVARRLGATSVVEGLRRLSRFTLNGLPPVSCPVLALVSRGEGSGALDEVRKAREHVSGPFTVYEFDEPESSSRSQVDNPSAMTRVLFDWLDELWPRPIAI